MDEIRVTRSVELDAAIEDVWRALTDPELLGDWLAGHVDLDVRPGGRGTIVEPDGAVRGAQVEEVTPARRLSLRWWPEDGTGPESTVAFEIEETPDFTRVTVTETVVARAGAPSASAVSGRWAVRFLLLGCYLLRASVLCR